MDKPRLIFDCRGQMIHDGRGNIKKLKDGIPSEHHAAFEAFLETVRYGSVAKPGVCAILTQEVDNSLLRTHSFDECLSILRDQYTAEMRYMPAGFPEIKFQNGMPWWSEYRLTLDFPDKLFRYYRKDTEHEFMGGFYKEPGGEPEIPLQTMYGKTHGFLSEILFDFFRQGKPVEVMDLCCSKFLLLGNGDSEPDQSSRITDQDFINSIGKEFKKSEGGRRKRKKTKRKKTKRKSLK
jgi:hypothetical protein